MCKKIYTNIYNICVKIYINIYNTYDNKHCIPKQYQLKLDIEKMILKVFLWQQMYLGIKLRNQ